MRAGIARGKALEATPGRTKQRLPAPPPRRLPVMPQGKGVVGLRTRMGLERLVALGHHRGQGPLWLAPRRQEMPAHKRQRGHDWDDLAWGGHGGAAARLARASPPTIALPWDSPPLAMAPAPRHRYRPVGDLGEEHPARACRGLGEHGPHQGLLHLATLAPRTKGWTGILIEGPLARGEGPDVLRLTRQGRMPSARAPSWVQGYVSPQQNQQMRSKISKSCGKSVDVILWPVLRPHVVYQREIKG
jgi:hypothetical protein